MLALAAVLCAAGTGLAGERFRLFNIVPYSPGQEKRLAADCREYVARTGNRTCLYSLTLHPEGRPAMTKVDRALESYRALREELKGSDVELGILVQAIMGHWARVDREVEPWTRTRILDGRDVRFCPLDPGFADYIRTVGRRCAAEKPCFIMGDDDIRAFSAGPECFCERHRKLFSERMGRAYSDEESRAAVRESHPGDKVQTTFMGLQHEMVCRIAGLLREGIDAVDPTIPASACQPGWEHRFADRAAKAIAAKGLKPMLRFGNARYCEKGAGGWRWNVLHTLALAARYEGVVDALDEADTYPHNYWSKSAISFHTHLAMAAMCGLKGAKIWYVNAHKHGFPVNRGYTDVLADHRGYYDAIVEAVEGSTVIGFTTPCTRDIPDGPFPTYPKNTWAELHSYSLSQAGYYGVPLRASFDLAEKGAVYSLSSAEEVARHTDAQLKSILSCRAFVDGEAALELTKRGCADLIGCSATNAATGFTCELDAKSGRYIVLAPSDKPPELRPLAGAVPLSWLCFKPFSGSTDSERIAPGSLVYTNRLGGVVVTGAFRNDTSTHHAVSESRKQWFVDCLDVLNGGFTPFVCGNPQEIVTVARRSPRGYAVVSVCNACPDAMRGVSLRLPAEARTVSVLEPHGTWRELAFKRDADGYATLGVNVPYYDTAVFKLR